MLKEIKYSIFFFLICLFLFLVLKYYFSDDYKKKSYRSLDNVNERIIKYSNNLPVLESDTKNFIEYVDQNKNKKKKYNFWNSLNNDSK